MAIRRIEVRIEDDDPVLLMLEEELGTRGKKIGLPDLLYEIAEAWTMARRGDWRRLVSLLPPGRVESLLAVGGAAPAIAPAPAPTPEPEDRAAQAAAAAWLDLLDE